MTLQVLLFLFVCFLLRWLALFRHLNWLPLHHSLSRRRARPSRAPRLLKPHTPLDCPTCRRSGEHSSVVEPPPPPVRPWRELKSRRGAPKRVNTEGFACPNQQCPYFGIKEAQIHALVGDGQHGLAERIQTFRCQACHRTFTARRHTPLYRLKTPSHQIATVLSTLAEGLDASAAERVFGFRQTTITHWVTRAGLHAESLHERCFRTLQIPHIQLDELRTRLRCSTQVLWLWLAIDPLTKILPVLQLGPRTQNMAHLFIHSLRELLAPGCLPLFTSDGLNLYFYALTAHFGRWVAMGRRRRNVRRWQVESGLIYGQVKKSYRRRKLVRVSQVMRLGTQAALRDALRGLGFSGRLNTAFIERVNLTVRHGVAALARRTWATAQQSPHLLAQLEWWRAYYHFVRPHASLREALGQPRARGGRRLAQRYRQRTPAMAAGRTTRRWTAREVLGYPLSPRPPCTLGA
jgi:IS1 family transposase